MIGVSHNWEDRKVASTASARPLPQAIYVVL